jgi:hypothetical protein
MKFLYEYNFFRYGKFKNLNNSKSKAKKKIYDYIGRIDFYENENKIDIHKIDIDNLYYNDKYTTQFHIYSSDIDKQTYIDKCMNVFRNYFIKLFLDKIKPEKDINKIIYNKLFDYRDTFLSLDEKVELFKKSFNGKVKSIELEKFILNSNELSSLLIKNTQINDNHVKYTLLTGNYKLLNIIADMKFQFKIQHFKYIISKNNFIEILNIINKYKPFNFSENIEWYKYIEHILTDLDNIDNIDNINIDNINIDNIIKIIYNDNNEDLQEKLKNKIQEYHNSKINIKELNKMEFNDFCNYIITNNIKIDNNLILQFDCLEKRIFLDRLK